MNKILFIATGLLFLFSCGKNEEISFSFKRLPDSCDEDYEIIESYKRDSTYIENKIITDSVTSLKIRFVDPCCMQFEGDYELKNDTLFLSYHQSNEEMCSCLCCYYYHYEIKGLKTQPKHISVSQKR